ncbi:hypothetical protein SAMN04490202_5476 [Pseudomonas reinekei]|uniref:TniQ protein n=2 Tax=Pseudomonas reinekei TaxID=395598 RepID=A0A1H0UKL5_PSERE|nr:hypothetical protein SAMN04490202_5476 [Pseudomonas reinekei]
MEPRYCSASPKYIPFESAYSILSRFGLYNVLYGERLIDIFRNSCHSKQRIKSHPRLIHLACTQSVDLDVMARTLSLPAWKVESLFLSPTYVKYDKHISETLKICPLCLAQGRHYTIFQHGLVHQCPIHRVDLRQRCPTCSAVVRYALTSSLFKVPYGCWHCGEQLGERRSAAQMHFINSAGIANLQKSYRALELSKGKRFVFSIGEISELYYDSVLQFSTSIRKFARLESDLFREIQVLAAELTPKRIGARYPWCRLRNKTQSKQLKDVPAIAPRYLLSIAKSIFRHFRKHRVGRFNWSNRTLRQMWRPIEACSVPPDCYAALALLDWHCFWWGSKTPSCLSSPISDNKHKVAEWLAEINQHSVFLNCPDSASKNWLTQHIFGRDVLAMLTRQLEEGWRQSDASGDIAATMFTYERMINPVCWAAYFSEHQNNMRIFFIGRPATTTPMPIVAGHGDLGARLLKECVDLSGFKYF